MISKRNAALFITCLLSFALANLVLISTAKSGDFMDDFNSGVLNEGIWDMKAEGGATYAITNGNLTMTSPGVSDGILMYWKDDIDSTDFTVEVKASVTADTDNAAVIAFLKEELPPTANTTINPAWKSIIWCGKNTPGWYINNDSWKNTGVKGPEFEGTWKMQISGNQIKCYLNGAEVVAFDKVDGDRFLCFGPDTYTSHYSGAMTIDWIRVSGPTIAAVKPVGKLPVMWSELKSKS